MEAASEELRILGIGLVGAGFSRRAFERGLELSPHVIASDGGTSDGGPYFLGSGAMDAVAIGADLEVLIEGALRIGVPLIVGSIGTAGGDKQVEQAGKIVEEIAARRGWRFKLALIHSGQDKAHLRQRLKDGHIQPFRSDLSLREEDIESSEAIVGMMGVEPFMAALDEGADVILAGRTTDPAIFAGPALRAGIDPAIAWHAARTIDKGPLMTASVQLGPCAFVRIRNDHFVASATLDEAICTPRSVSSIGIYESDDPFSAVFPSGTLDMSECRFEAADERSVRVSGARYSPASGYSVKLEGARMVGFRSIMIMGIRDPFLIRDLPDFLDTVRAVAARNLAKRGIAAEDYQLRFRIYGIDGVMGQLEPRRREPHEVGVIVEAVAADQATANAVARRHFSVALHAGFKGRLTTAGNIANPFSGPTIAVGPVYEWSVWHLMQVDDWRDVAWIEYLEIGA